MNKPGEIKPWAIPKRIAPSIPIIELENNPKTTTPIWAIEEYAINLFVSCWIIVEKEE